jgi:hypothetical protein
MAIPREGDPIWRLYIFYFVPCELMYHHHRRLKGPFFSNEIQREEFGPEFMTFTLYWFASLFVVAEGWRGLNLTDPRIDNLINQHWDSLKLFRNAVFHYQRKDQKHVQFFDADKFNWGEALHAALRAFLEEHVTKTG